MKFNRYLKKTISSVIHDKMVFIGGPRQVGKTTLARGFIQSKAQYLTWDDLSDREIIKRHEIDTTLKTVVLDEIHKYYRWRTLLKGLFDKFGDVLSILVTGSARLDYFRKGGDSLVGRYRYFRLHPLSLGELDKKYSGKTLQRLLQFGGFPEPYFKKSEAFYRIWRRERLARVVYQDISDLGTVKELSKIDLLVSALPAKVGSVLSINSLAEDLEASPNTVAHWLQILELIYYCHRVLPYGTPRIRAVKKSAKLYLWDWAEVTEMGPRFENMVAAHLLKYCHYIEDTQGYKMELRFIRDVDLREIDFVVLRDNKPLFAVECKTGESHISRHLHYYRERTPIPQFYQVHLGQKDITARNIRLLPFSMFCRLESIP